MATKVGIISSYRTRCGIASFTETLVSLLGETFDIEVLVLDQFTLRSRHVRVEKLGDQLIDDIGARLSEFDVINFQWEPGLLGATRKQVIRRTKRLFKAMIAARKPIVIAAHTVLTLPPSRFSLGLMFDEQYRYVARTHHLLRYLDARCDLTLVAHTPRDRAYFQHVIGLRQVVDHPLSYMRDGWPDQVARGAAAYRERIDRQVGPGKKVIGTFGFLSDYKGMEVAIRAMRDLPDPYVLLIYGEVHGENVKPWQSVNSYVAKLMGESSGDPDSLRRVLISAPQIRNGSNMADVGQISAELRSELFQRSKPIMDRVYFMGSPDDYEFALAVKAVDVCVFPYLEIGQSASGPVSQAVELGKPTALSRTKTFTELENYYPHHLSFFDIGNYLQLAQILSLLATDPPRLKDLHYDQNSLKMIYGRLFGNSKSAVAIGVAA